ncbi:MAG: ion transporter [Saccharofermentans sp.]|nr:ion transporter [Saccharofermentans sp.]
MSSEGALTKKTYRKRLFEVIEIAEDGDKLSNVYDVFMMVTIVASIVPMAFKTTNVMFDVIDKVTVTIFIIDYVLRLITADLKLNKCVGSFFLYPITPMAIIDLVAILPSLIVINSGFRLLKIFRLLRTLRVLRVFKVVRYSTPIQMILGIFKRTKESLLFVCGIAVGYVLISALVVFNVEPDTFDNFFDAVYWATVSLTTMGYGDIYPVTVAGKIVTMISSFMGIAIVALPAGIITTGLMEEINESKTNTNN